MTDHDRLLTITEAAELLRIPVATLRERASPADGRRARPAWGSDKRSGRGR
jgi:hypothetical protein